MKYSSRASTDLLPIGLRPDTYAEGSLYNSYNMFSNDEYDLKNSKGGEKLIDQYRDEFDNDKMKQSIYNHRTEIVIPCLNDTIQSVLPGFLASPQEGGTLNSPQYYNYGTDRINFDFTIDMDELIAYVKENEEKIREFISEKYSSRSGFISFTPNTLSSLYEGLNEEDDVSIFAIINFILHQEEDTIKDIVNMMYENYHEYFNMTDYCSAKLGRKISKILDC